MGRKSNAKKIVRELIKEKEEAEKKKLLGKIKKKSKKELKKEVKKKAKAKSPKAKKSTKTKKAKKTGKLKVKKQKIFAGLFALIMITILVWIGVFLFDKAFRAKPIAKFLPAENTVLSLELNTDIKHLQNIKTFELLEKYPEYSKDNLTKIVESKFDIDFYEEIEPWLGRQVGFAIIDTGEGISTFDELFFVETFSRQGAYEYISKGAKKEQYTGFEILSLPPKADFFKLDEFTSLDYPNHVVFIENYLVASSNQEALTSLIDSINENAETLYDSAKYRRVDDNLPFQRIGFFYIDFEKASASLVPLVSSITKDSSLASSFELLTNFFSAEGISLSAKDNQFAVQSFLVLKVDELEDEKFLSLEEKYQGELLNYLPEDVLAFWGGKNFEYQLNRLDQISDSAFDSILESGAKRYFGKATDLKEDILPLLKNEFILAIEEIDSNINYKVLIEMQNPDEDFEKLDKLMDSIAKVEAVATPQTVEYILEDGTYSREIVAMPEEIIKSEEDYNGTTIHKLELKERGASMAYAIRGDIAILSTETTGVKNSLDLMTAGAATFRNSELFTLQTEPILQSSDEIAYFNFEGILPLILDGEEIPGLLKPLEAFSSGKNYFNDGIVTINFLSIK